MSIKIKKGRALATLSLTPLIDVVFLLLIFFLVATRFEEEERSLDVMLPTASEALPESDMPLDLVVNIDRQGHFVVQRRQIGAAELERILQQASANNPGRQTVTIRPDRRCPVEYVVTVMDLCVKAHIRHYPIATTTPPAAQ